MSSNTEMYDLIIIGGGASGFFCAINAAQKNPQLRIAIIEKTSKLLSKVKISGGGRCNVTHDKNDIADLVKFYPRGQNFLKKAFHHFGPRDTVEWFSQRGIPLKIENDGRMFPSSNTSQSIIDCFIKEINNYQIPIFMNAGIDVLSRTENYWSIGKKGDRMWKAKSVCVTCGGFNKKEQYSWLENLGLKIETPVPSLFTFNLPQSNIKELMGVSVPKASVKIIGSKLQSEGPLLITHWGLSGPCVLKLSAIAARYLSDLNYQFQILVNWLSDYTESTLRNSWLEIRNKAGRSLMTHKNPFGLPSRLWQYFLVEAQIPAQTFWSELKSNHQNKLIQLLTASSFSVSGKTTFKEEFVTCGGVSLSEIDANSMECRKLERLYFCGEVLDIDGVTGGFNFQNAWTTGWIAAQSIVEKL